ncbi:hypothetical protein AB0H71_30030 [Nocardia sp. NPDC050697]|uniref:hypothetical protein n=1 Tax=Nocardia sp. NPDC050697 TaxID=3155158 RepID=UPI0033FC67A8
MTGPTPDADSRTIAVMRLSGARFNSDGMPADALVEIAAFEDILRSLVRLYWHDRHPGRKRMPKGYDDEITLRLTAIGDGSAVPVLEHDSTLRANDLFGPYEIKQDFARAIDTLEQFVNYGYSDKGRIPTDIRRLPSNKMKKFGQTIRKGEAIQVAATVPDSWDTITRYTPDARRNALVTLIGNFTRPVTVEGQVIDFNVSTGRLVVRDREHKGDIPIPYLESGLSASIDSAKQLFECVAEGVGEFNADGRLIKLITVISLDVTDVTEDARVVRASLDALADLNDGWVDGESGEAITQAVIERGNAVIDAMIALSNITRTVVPTEDGGVSFFWPDAENQLSIEVEPTCALYVHTTNLAAGTFADDKIAPDVINLVDTLDSWLSEVTDG